jgi:uncharacterized phage protein (TIGR01671 family)
MRDLRFRVWDKEGREMHRLGGILWAERLVITEADRRGDEHGMRLEDVELMQYTGLKDRHGIPIYESDFVVSLGHDKPVEVIYQANGFYLRIDDGEGDFELDDIFSFPVEVVGNRYENPELVQGGGDE